MSSDLVLVRHRNPHELRAYLAREQARGAVIVRRGVTEVAPGEWAAAVEQLRRPRRRWLIPVAAATVTLGGAGAVGWWLVSVAAPILLGAGAVLAGLWLVTRRRSGGCTTTVTVTVTHRH